MELLSSESNIAHNSRWQDFNGVRNGKWCAIDEVNLEELAGGFEKELR